eukprot:1448099-Pleurochrysis_carterae.AAC.1
MVAAVLGVVVAVVGTQMRRLLVLCENARKPGKGDDASKMSFFVSTWAAWRRMPPDFVAEPPDFDVDDDENVCTLSKQEIHAMLM